MRTIQCCDCGKKVMARSNRQLRCSVCGVKRRRAYRHTPKYKARKRAYYQTPEYKARYQTPEYRARRRAYQRTPEYKARYQTPKYRAHRRAYQRTAKYRAYQHAYRQKPAFKTPSARSGRHRSTKSGQESTNPQGVTP